MAEQFATPLAIYPGLSYEEVERCRQTARESIKRYSLKNLRIIRARLADFLSQDPPERIASIIIIRGELVHAEIKNQEASRTLRARAAFHRFATDFREPSMAEFTTIFGWNDKSTLGRNER